MILWNRGREYLKWYTADDIEEVSKEIVSTNTRNVIKFLNIVVNAIACLAACIIFKANILALALVFIATDMLLLSIDYFMFIAIPHWKTTHVTLDKAKERLNKLEQKRDAIAAIDARCFSLSSGHDWKILADFINDEKRWIEKEEKRLNNKLKEEAEQAAAKAELERKERCKANNADTRSKLVSILKTLNSVKPDMPFFSETVVAVNKLITTLDWNPDGYKLIPAMMWVYFNELQLILNQCYGLGSLYRKEHMDALEKIAAGLTKETNELASRIENMVKDDLEVGISVLLKELSKNEGDENNV